MIARKVKLNTDLCIGCKHCVTACAIQHSRSRDLNSMIFEYPIPYARMRIIVKKDKPVVQKCVHCKKPKCIDVCEHDAIRIENSLVLVDHDKCTGCWECVDVCPFSAIIKDERLNVAIKCDACYGYERLACVSACKVGALMER